jgi:putative hydrolase of the HAD superfamily
MREDWKQVDELVRSERISHVSFDFWRTLAFSNERFKTKRAQLIRENSNFNDIDIFAAFSEIGGDYNLKMETKNEIVSPLVLYGRVFEMLSISKEFHRELYEETLSLFLKYPPILNKNCLKSLIHFRNTSISCSITSNTAFIPGKTILNFLTQSGISENFKFCLFSDATGCSKPHDSMYQLVLDNAFVSSRKEILHIGDNQKSDIDGAIKFGFKALFVDGRL